MAAKCHIKLSCRDELSGPLKRASARSQNIEKELNNIINLLALKMIYTCMLCVCIHVCCACVYMYVVRVYTCMLCVCIHVCCACVYMYVVRVYTCMYIHKQWYTASISTVI